MALVAFSILVLIYLNTELKEQQQGEFKNITQKVTLVESKVNAVSTKLNFTDSKVDVGLKNDRIIANGINDLGSIVIGDITDIKSKTDLIDDIKFDTSKIINNTNTAGNITFSQGNKTDHLNVTVSQ